MRKLLHTLEYEKFVKGACVRIASAARINRLTAACIRTGNQPTSECCHEFFDAPNFPFDFEHVLSASLHLALSQGRTFGFETFVHVL